MTDSITPNLGLTLPTVFPGDQWGGKLNANFSAIDLNAGVVTAEFTANTAQFTANAAKNLATVAALLADTTLAYVAGTGKVVVATSEIVEAGGFRYAVAASGASDQHVTTAGGVKLYVQPDTGGYNVKAFGAVGDGVADDTAEIQKALDAAGALSLTDPSFSGYGYVIKGGATVTVPAGMYLLTATITIPQNVSVEGAGKYSTIFKSSYNGDLIRNAGTPTVTGTYDVAGIALRNFSVIGDRAQASQVGMAFLRLTSATVENISVSKCGNNGVSMFQCGVNQINKLECIYNVGNGLLMQSGFNSWADLTPNSLPSNANTFVYYRGLQNDAAGIRFSNGTNGNKFFGANCEYNYWTAGNNVGYNVHSATNSAAASPNVFYGLWTEGPVQYHVYVANSSISVPIKLHDWHHFANGVSGNVDRALGVDTGTAVLVGATGQAENYKTIAGSNAPFRIINKGSAIIHADNCRGNLVSGLAMFEDNTGVYTGLFNNLKLSGTISDGTSFGPQKFYNDGGGVDGFALQNDSQSHPFFQSRAFYRDILLGDGSTAPDAGMQRLSAGQIGPRAGDFFNAGSAWNGSHLLLGLYHIWVDGTGDLRIKNGAPASDTDGTVIGTQT